MAAPSEKSFVTLGQLCTILGNEIIVSDSTYDPNGILPGTWGHYEGTTWYDTAEILTVIKDSTLVANGKLFYDSLSAFATGSSIMSNGSGRIGWTTYINGQANSDIYYNNGIKIKETQNIYRWYKK